MIILAKAIKGQEYLYNAHSARQVSKASAKKICEIVNQHKFQLGENEIWHIYEIDEYDLIPFHYASRQKFTIRNGIVTARNY